MTPLSTPAFRPIVQIPLAYLRGSGGSFYG